jgi:hypothetical protein
LNPFDQPPRVRAAHASNSFIAPHAKHLNS